jgi:hypothetical protein
MKKMILILLLLITLLPLMAATMSGYVTGRDNGEALSYASVIIRGSNLGALTNAKGYYVLNNIPPGKHEVFVSHMGYRPVTKQYTIIRNRTDLFESFELETQAQKIQGITVSEERIQNIIHSREIKVSNVLRTTEDLKAVPQVAEPDVFRALLVQPGVTPISDFSNGLYVRGGSPDQNLILLDGIDVYNPSHFGGIFSTFNTDAVKDVELMKGGYPAKYGGRLSSVLNVTNRDGNRKHPEGVARVSLISTSATIEGPWRAGSQQGSYMVSGRRTYLELLKKALNLNFPDYYFYDGHAKVNWDLSQKDKISMSTYFGKDNLGFNLGQDLHIDWGNETLSTQWTHIFTPQLFSHFIMAFSHFGSGIDVNSDADEYFKRKNDVNDLTVKGEMNWRFAEDHLVDYGFECKLNNITFEMDTNSDADEEHLPNIEVHSTITSGYLHDSWQVSPDFTLEPGVRVAWCHTENVTHQDNPTSDYMRVSPRLAARYMLTDASTIYASAGRYWQYLNLISYGESSPFDLWFPIDDTIKPGRSEHYILGYSHELSGRFALESEIYYKIYRNLVSYRPEADYEWNNSTGTMADALNAGRGYSYGLDLMFRTNLAGFEGFVGYSYGETRRRIANENLDPETGLPRYYYPKYDRTHQITVMENYNLTEQLGVHPLGSECRIGFTWSYYSGQPYSQPEQAYFDGEHLQFLYSHPDAYRLPDYSRLDLGINLRYDYENYSVEPYLQVINVLNTKNVWTRGYDAPIDPSGAITLQQHDEYMFPLIPTVGINILW